MKHNPFGNKRANGPSIMSGTMVMGRTVLTEQAKKYWYHDMKESNAISI